MKLRIRKVNYRGCEYFHVMRNYEVFCKTTNFENAKLIVSFLESQENKIPEIKKSETLDSILQRIKEKTNIDLKTDFSQFKEACDLRKISARLAKENGYNLIAIGKLINRDHSSIIYMLKKFDDFYQTDPDFRNLYNKIKN